MLEPANGCEAEHNHHSHTKTKGPEILRNKVHTGWGWQILLWKNLKTFFVQKIHHKSTLQISGPKFWPESETLFTIHFLAFSGNSFLRSLQNETFCGSGGTGSSLAGIGHTVIPNVTDSSESYGHYIQCSATASPVIGGARIIP